jgi:hypothetical protein
MLIQRSHGQAIHWLSPSRKEKAMKKVLTVTWLLACAAVLLIAVYAYEPNRNSDIGPLFLWLMILLTFPSGLLVASSGAMLVMALGVDTELSISSTVYHLSLWSAFVVVGYLQWFRALPWLWRKIRESRSPVKRQP